MRNSAQRSLQGLADDGDTDFFILIGALQAVQRRDSVHQSNAATSNNALFNSSTRCLQSVFNAALGFLQFGLGSSAHLQNGYAAGKLCQALLQLLAVEIGVGVIDFRANLSNASVNDVLVTCAIDNQAVVLGNLDGLCGTH